LADLRAHAKVALDELQKKDFAYVHVELPDEVVYDPDVKAKVRAIEALDGEFVGPFLEGMAALGPYRLVTISDPGSVHQSNMGHAHWPYAYQDSSSKPTAGKGRRFTEADAKALAGAPRDATKFVVRLFAKGS
jgi:2,3-bisphosphoglycerate-independent phosphoglycerate mutase